jgi:hypothetical protein
MIRFTLLTLIAIVAAGGVFAQPKGIDTQTQKIKETSNKTTSRETDATRSFDWGKGKTVVRERLPNPYKLGSRRDVLLNTIREVLKEKKIVVDEASSRFADGVVVTQPFVFAKGPVIAQSELSRYGVLEVYDDAWSRGRYTLIIEVQSIDGVQNNVSVNAKIEGRSGNGLATEWTSVQSSGLAEEEFLKALVEAVTGTSLDPVQDVPKP